MRKNNSIFRFGNILDTEVSLEYKINNKKAKDEDLEEIDDDEDEVLKANV